MVRRAKYLVLVGWLIAAGSAAGGEQPRFGLPWDWSHRAMIHKPETAAEAMAKGKYDEWERNFRDPRFALAALKKMERAQSQVDAVAKKAQAGKAAAAVGGIIDHYYLTVLNRAPDAGGKAFYLGEVDRLLALSVDQREALRVISKYFFYSPEYIGSNHTDGDFVEDLYQVYLDRASDPDGKAYWLAQLSAGLNREALMVGFMFSDEFRAFMDNALGESAQRAETALVMDAYRSTLSRIPDSDGFTSWREWVREGQCEGTIRARAHDLMVNFVQSPEYLSRNRTSRQYVADLYDAVFRRTPDTDGFNFWAGRIESGAMTREQVLEAFLASEEWEVILFALGEAGCASVASVPRDWSNVMGGAGGVGFKGTFPAKYAFDASAAPSCANDFVVYTTAAAGVAGTGNFATRTSNAVGGALSGSGGALNNLVRITNGTRVLTLTLGATNTGLNFTNAGSNAARAANIAAAINRNGGTVGVRATSNAGGQVIVTAITQGAGGNAIALAEGLTNFSWGSGTLAGGSGTAGQPTIIAFNQLYKTTCDDAAVPPVRPLPDTFWSYNTGAGNFVETSPVISLDGTQVAFMERSGATVSLVLLKWSSTVSVGTVGAPTAPPLAASAAAYRACAAPCMFKISTGQNNTRSSPYYDYVTDELYVGAANGTLHKFTGVFLGNPAAAGGVWPVTVSAGNALSSPVYDQYQGLVFVGSARSAGSGGQLHSVSAAGTVVSSGTLAGLVGGTPGTGVAESPVVDANALRVYAFVASDNSSACNGGADPCQAVYQFPTNASIAGLTAPRAQIGRGGQFARTLKSGAFDDNYWSSSVTSPTGFLYVCGALGDTSDTDRPTLWRIPITANVMGAPAVGPGLTIAAGPDSAECSPITEVLGGTGTDFLFVSVPNASIFGCGGGGCMFMFNITNILPANWATTTPVAVLAAPGGTGGIVIDNLSSATGAAQIYYSTLANPGNAIQASQAGLN